MRRANEIAFIFLIVCLVALAILSLLELIIDFG